MALHLHGDIVLLDHDRADVCAPDVPELVLGGGVACNERLREMAHIMAKERGIKCFVPSKELCVDNGVMIGWLGSQMIDADYQITDEDNVVNQKYRTDMVEVTWR